MIKVLEIQETRDTPKVLFDANKSQFEIKGNSLPENTEVFFAPIFDWIEEYQKNPNDTTVFVCELDYFNSSSAKIFYEIFLEFEKISKTGKQVIIKWIYESDDKLIEEKGSEYQSILSVPFEMVTK